MAIVKQKFWRLAPSDELNPTAGVATLAGPRPLIAKLSPRDGIVLASWNPDDELGSVHSLGRVLAVDHASGLATVEWLRAHFTLRPSPQGRRHWTDKTFFEFERKVAVRYRLLDHFTTAFDAPTADSVPTSGRTARGRESSRPTAPDSSTDHTRGGHPQCNRVTPRGEVIAASARGTFMGNRASPTRWLVCALHFNRDLAEPRKYTKLFFLDEAVALAAGHRPCNTCRPSYYRAFLASTQDQAGAPIVGAGQLDTELHRARSANRAAATIPTLPDGVFVELADDDLRVVWNHALHRWTPAGYVDPIGVEEYVDQEVRVLTPPPSVAALRHGYPVVVHPSVAHGW